MLNNFLSNRKNTARNDEENARTLKSFSSVEKSMKNNFALIVVAVFAFCLFTSATSAQWWHSGVGMRIGGGGNATQKCGNTEASCGPWPNCVDIRNITYCVNNKVVNTYCSFNVIRNRTTSTACTEFGLNVVDDDESEADVNYRLYSVGTTSKLAEGSLFGYGRIRMNGVVLRGDFEFEYDDARLKFLIKNLDMSKVENKKIIMDMKDFDPHINNTILVRAYHVELPTDFSFSSIILKLTYEDDEVDNPNMLAVYRCGSFNNTANKCSGSWTRMTGVSIDTANNIVSLTLSNFSVYMLAEQDVSTTTTTTIPSNTTSTTTTTTTSTTVPTTTTTSSGGNGGSDYYEDTTTVEETETTIPTTIEEQLESAATTENVTQQTQSATGFSSLIDQNKLVVISPFIAVGAAVILYYSFQNSQFPKYSGKSKVFKKLQAPKSKKNRSSKHGTVLRL